MVYLDGRLDAVMGQTVRGVCPELRETEYGKEMWSRYASGRLDADSPLTGIYHPSTDDVNLGEVMAIIDAAREEEKERLERMREDASG